MPKVRLFESVRLRSFVQKSLAKNVSAHMGKSYCVKHVQQHCETKTPEISALNSP
jgi:hypothetical protein